VSIIFELQNEVRYLAHRLNNVNKPAKVPNYGYDVMEDRVLLKEKISKLEGVGLSSKSANERGGTSKDTHGSRTKVTMSNHTSKHSVNSILRRNYIYIYIYIYISKIVP